MKEMTTAEFAKANLAALAEPISVRRYTTTVGVYYPAGAAPEALNESLNLIVPTEELTAASSVIADLEEEVSRLKKELAARPAANVMTVSSAVGKLIRSDDPFASLPKQDREFFERKLGTKKGKA